jgi:hypothetical protein
MLIMYILLQATMMTDCCCRTNKAEQRSGSGMVQALGQE